MEKPSKYPSNSIRIQKQSKVSILFLKKQFQQKQKCWISRRPFRRVTFRAICFYFNKSLENDAFPICLKLANITPVFKPGAHASKITLDQLVFSLFFQRYLKGYLADNFQSSLIIYCINFNVVLERVGCKTQHCLLLMLETRKGATDNNKAFGSSFAGFSNS